eukprot:CAMPEP_0118703896 /NCGR_PEP_ID=MMETSP0800-20121206/18869_1 /TAXON_ID=210618 ORGANISM="Striatella unipunctata, Strain CCMP2910" /NCGR_SAMPLE_ID=MMETSP0800 /ASSEMBLY_ACC=CAM_ASM_000638 /LENGTH=201 /DNA_ID=CAMNT_0006605595 /DNA_START=16 /DNA_END=621 /DNA_ORIENTATION=-
MKFYTVTALLSLGVQWCSASLEETATEQVDMKDTFEEIHRGLDVLEEYFGRERMAASFPDWIKDYQQEQQEQSDRDLQGIIPCESPVDCYLDFRPFNVCGLMELALTSLQGLGAPGVDALCFAGVGPGWPSGPIVRAFLDQYVPDCDTQAYFYETQFVCERVIGTMEVAGSTFFTEEPDSWSCVSTCILYNEIFCSNCIQP